MPTITIEFGLNDPVKVRGPGDTWITGTVLKIHHGEWMSQAVQNRFYVKYDTPISEIGEWYHSSKLVPNGATAASTFGSICAIDEVIYAPSGYSGFFPTACKAIHYGPMNWPTDATVDVYYMLVPNDTLTYGTGQWYPGSALGV